MSASLSDAERRVCENIAAHRDAIVALARELIGFDTQGRGSPDEPARDEAALQEHLATRLRGAGASAEVWEPAASDVAGHPLAPPGIGFAGRPQMVARFPGTGGGRSLLLNGHIDVVSVTPREAWRHDPFGGVEEGGLLHGRGSCDMKGGIASMIVAAETLRALGIPLAGDLAVCTVTDEESSGVGALAAARHGVRADACIVPEPSSLELWVACRGTVYATVRIPGRAGHAEVGQPDWRDGGAVNAIEKTRVLLDAIAAIRADWAGRGDLTHAYLSPPDVLPTTMDAGDWHVTIPREARLTLAVLYLPQQADAEGWATDVAAEVERRLVAACAADPWLAEHPPTFDWQVPVNPSEVPVDAPIVQALADACGALGRPVVYGGLDSWFDGATFTLEAQTPSLMFGPRSIESAHTVGESVPIEDLVVCAQGIAVAAMRFCGTAG